MVAALQHRLNSFSANTTSKAPSSYAATFPAPLTEPASLTQPQRQAQSPASAPSLQAATEKAPASQTANQEPLQKLAALRALADSDEVDVANTHSFAAAVYRASVNSTLPKFFGTSSEGPASFKSIPHGVEAAATISENRPGNHLQNRSLAELLTTYFGWQKLQLSMEGCSWFV